jgi:hypothetical protein
VYFCDIKNKPMKLYTEEQVVQIVSWLTTDDITREDIKSKLKGLIQINALAPIELPSDEDMEQEAYYKVSDHTENPYASFKSGAKWMKEQMINQNK